MCLAQGWQCPFLSIEGNWPLQRYRCGVGGGEICEEDLQPRRYGGETGRCPLEMEEHGGPSKKRGPKKRGRGTGPRPTTAREQYDQERTRWEMSRKGKDQLAWDEIMPKTGKTLYEEAMELRATRISWNEVAQTMTATHGIELKGSTVSSMTKYHSDPERQAKRKKKAEALGGGGTAASPPRPPSPSGETPALGRRGETEGRDPVPARIEEAEEGRARGDPSLGSGQAGARPTRGGAPCVVHIARDGLEIWISAADENELRTKAAQMINVLDLVVNL